MSNFTNVNPNKHNICLLSQVSAIFWLEQVDLTLFISRSGKFNSCSCFGNITEFKESNKTRNVMKKYTFT